MTIITISHGNLPPQYPVHRRTQLCLNGLNHTVTVMGRETYPDHGRLGRHPTRAMEARCLYDGSAR
ncbi:hypothetical protein [Streptomyces kronopolitis]|uniref:hypothetical protein n=1 Tax=Streptomyces kronopolitis TaxID=1612435 RepID=UPI003D97A908